MTLIDLYTRAEALGIAVDDVPMRALSSVSFPEGWIAIDTSKISTQAEEKALLAHELGHIQTGSFYNIHSPYDLRARHERRADKYSIELLVPRKDFRRALRQGIREIWELAEHFGVPESLIHKAADLYSNNR